MNEYVAGVALPESMMESEGMLTVSGWGTLSSGGSCCPMKLMKVDVPFVTDAACKVRVVMGFRDGKVDSILPH